MSRGAGRFKGFSRRNFLKMASFTFLASLIGCEWPPKPVVSVVKVKSGDVNAAVREAIDLLGGMENITRNKQRICVKPNMVGDYQTNTTNPWVVSSLVAMMKEAGKDVFIGEGSAVASTTSFDRNGTACYLKDENKLEALQRQVFDALHYTDMARLLNVPLVNFHTGDLVEVNVPHPLAYDKLWIHKKLTEIDLLCSVPMMKTHYFAVVTLGMKNLIGLYPGKIYGSLRSGVHDYALTRGSPRLAYEIIDMVQVNKLGLTVIDGTKAMEGEGPAQGHVFDMNVIIAGTNPLATDIVGAHVMGFRPDEIPHFVVANEIGMGPFRLDKIRIKLGGMQRLDEVCRNFERAKDREWDQVTNLCFPV